METSKEEALRAKEIAEKRFAEKDFLGAKNYALEAKTLWPGLDGISQMVATFEVYVASALRVNNEVDYYSVLGLKPSADKHAVKRQYRKLAVLLHPDKNKCVGADGAFKLVSEAWTLLSDSTRKSSYDFKRSSQSSSVSQKAVHVSASRVDTFWTVCSSCKVQYEYLRKYVNKRLSCKNCRGIFIAVETGTGPVNGAFPYSPFTYAPSNGNHGSAGLPYGKSYPRNGVSGQGYEMSFQWGSGSSSSMAAATATAAATENCISQSRRGNKDRSGTNGTRAAVSIDFNGCYLTKSGRPDKRRKVVPVVVGADFGKGSEVVGPRSSPEVGPTNGKSNMIVFSAPIELPTRRCSAVPAFNARKLMVDKARSEIRENMQHLMKAKQEQERKQKEEKEKEKEQEKAVQAKMETETQKGVVPRHKNGPVSITVPDPDFHDFDKDRSEECFKPKQIWALYDEEDGMPRLYCFIRDVISTNPFKIHITYLSSKSDTEFGAVNWLVFGFTKSCGHFRAVNSEIIEQVNIFSHILSKEKTGRGGCVKLYPRSGEIWAIYRNWSTNWNRSTPPEVRHQYEMVEVVDDYKEDVGICVTPLTKLSGYKTVYRRDRDSVRCIPRREMLRFSHQVPSWSLKPDNVHNLPDGCWDLDPAAIPEELLHEGTEVGARR